MDRANDLARDSARLIVEESGFLAISLRSGTIIDWKSGIAIN
jgi:hypothetical protein